MKAIDYVKLQTEQAFGLMNLAANGTEDAHYNQDGPGTANAVAKSHVHALTSADFFIMSRAKGADMIWQQFAPKHGLPANPQEVWAFSGAIPLAAVQEYATEVQKGALDYISTLTDADLDREVDTMAFGKRSMAFLLQLASMHIAGHAGDVAAVKGAHGLKGLPF